MIKKRIPWIYLCLMLPITTANALNLSQAELIAIKRANEIKELRYRQGELQSEAIAAKQLPDPVLQLGAQNLPVDTFSLSQEAMTQLQVGVMQVFPKGKTLKYRAEGLNQKALSVSNQASLERIGILKQVRTLWNQLYFWKSSRNILLKQRQTFLHLKEVAASLYSNDKVPQKDVLNAQLELSRIDERLITVEQQSDDTRVRLARWIGSKAAHDAHVEQFYPASKPVSRSILKQSLLHHPKIRIDNANIAGAKSDIELAKQDYLPGFSAGIVYGYRKNPGNPNINRPDFLSGTLKVSLPLFPKNRQSQRLHAKQQSLLSVQERFDADRKALIESLDSNFVTYNKTKKKLKMYRRALLPEVKQYAESTVLAYQNNRSDFINVAQSHIRWLSLELEQLKEYLNNYQSKINLLYLQGK